MACKPGSVPPQKRRRRPFIWDVRHRTPRAANPDGARKRACSLKSSVPIWSCSRWGLPCRPCCQARGALLPHPFTLTPRRQKAMRGGLLSVALSLGSPPPGVTRHRVSVEPGLSSPLKAERPSSHLAPAESGPSPPPRQEERPRLPQRKSPPYPPDIKNANKSSEGGTHESSRTI